MKTWMIVLLSVLVSCVGASDTMDTPADSAAPPPTDSPLVTPPDVLALDAATPPVTPVVLPPLAGTVAIPGQSFTVRQGAPTLKGSVWTMGTPPHFDELACEISIAPGTRISRLVWSVDSRTIFFWVSYDFKLVRIGADGQRTNFLERQMYSGVNYAIGYQLFDSAELIGPYITEPGFKYELLISIAASGAYEAPPLFDGVFITYE